MERTSLIRGPAFARAEGNGHATAKVLIVVSSHFKIGQLEEKRQKIMKKARKKHKKRQKITKKSKKAQTIMKKPQKSGKKAPAGNKRPRRAMNH